MTPTTDDEHKVMIIAQLSLGVRWAKKLKFKTKSDDNSFSGWKIMHLK
jgi:hypothetical protein